MFALVCFFLCFFFFRFAWFCSMLFTRLKHRQMGGRGVVGMVIVKTIHSR